MKTKSLLICFSVLLSACIDITDDDFNSIKLTSSKGETIYINSLNYGVTGDHQRTAITKDKNK